jgi:hypothetical protein
MTNGEVVFECREALLFYVLRRLNLEQPQNSRPEAQQIILKNADALRPYIRTETQGS